MSTQGRKESSRNEFLELFPGEEEDQAFLLPCRSTIGRGCGLIGAAQGQGCWQPRATLPAAEAITAFNTEGRSEWLIRGDIAQVEAADNHKTIPEI